MIQSAFEFDSHWLKFDFHLHTRAVKEFDYKVVDQSLARSTDINTDALCSKSARQ